MCNVFMKYKNVKCSCLLRFIKLLRSNCGKKEMSNENNMGSCFIIVDNSLHYFVGFEIFDEVCVLLFSNSFK